MKGIWKFFRMLLFIILLILPFFLNVYRKNLYLSTSARVIELENRILELESDVKKLQREYYRITSPTYIESIGRTMGFFLPDSQDIIIVEVQGD